MNAPIGIWIDHRSARVFDLREPSPCCLITIESLAPEERGRGKAMRHVPPHRLGGSREHHVKRRREVAIASYYRGVIDAIRDQPAVVVGGPGSAHAQLVAAIRDLKEHAPRIQAEVRLDTHLSEAQVVARLREIAREKAAV